MSITLASSWAGFAVGPSWSDLGASFAVIVPFAAIAVALVVVLVVDTLRPATTRRRRASRR